jgi:hypothetical protein
MPFLKNAEQKDKIKMVLSGGWYQWERRGYKERVMRVNIVEILCTHVCKGKNETC